MPRHQLDTLKTNEQNPCTLCNMTCFTTIVWPTRVMGNTFLQNRRERESVLKRLIGQCESERILPMVMLVMYRITIGRGLCCDAVSLLTLSNTRLPVDGRFLYKKLDLCRKLLNLSWRKPLLKFSVFSTGRSTCQGSTRYG